jgi:hypothetical protein
VQERDATVRAGDLAEAVSGGIVRGRDEVLPLIARKELRQRCGRVMRSLTCRPVLPSVHWPSTLTPESSISETV